MGSADQPVGRARYELRIASLILVAVASAAAGFFLVTTLAAPSASRGEPEREPDADPPDAALAAASKTGPSHDAGTVAAEVTLGEPYYWRCWGEGEEGPHNGDECGSLPPLERLVASRLGEAERCRDQSSNPSATGTLSLAVDVDFDETTLRLWSGRSSDLDTAEEVIACLREHVEGRPIDTMRHRWQRYTVFFPIGFGQGVGGRDAAPDAPAAVRLVLDRVRLRERPEKGRIIARLRRGEPVEILEEADGWVRVRTADSREGWIFTPAVRGEGASDE